MPPYEATYLGCPVIISDIPGHREQMGEAALYFDMVSADELAQKMMTTLLELEELSRSIRAQKELKVDIVSRSYIDDITKIFEELKRIIKAAGS